MKAFLFPGQGSQEVGMGADLFRSDAAFRDLVDLASECAGANLRAICLRGPERELVKTSNLQPLLVAVSLGYWGKLRRCGLEPDVVLGHSLGEISALAAAGVLSPEQAVRVAAKRGGLMAQTAEALAGGMIAILSPARQQVLEILTDLIKQGSVFVANDNSPDQLLVSGTLAGLEAAICLISTARLGSCRKLPVSGPWHTPFMSDAQKQFALWLHGVSFQAARVPLLMNVSARLERDAETIRQSIARSLTEPVQWRASMQHLRALRPEALFEVGPGRVLSGLARANGFGDQTRVINVNHERGVVLAALWLATGQESSAPAAVLSLPES